MKGLSKESLEIIMCGFAFKSDEDPPVLDKVHGRVLCLSWLELYIISIYEPD